MNTDKIIRYIVAFFTLIIITTFIIIINLAKQQDKEFVNNEVKYHTAIQNLQDGDYGQALILLQEVDQTNYKSSSVKYYLGMSYYYNNEYIKASQEFKKLVDIDPYLVEDASFMLLFAHTLIETKLYEEAKIVLERCKSLQSPPENSNYQEQVNEMIKATESSL